jgi:Pyridoxamine 5'-phosphate oxidase
MISWREFRDEAPTVAEIFERRHAATGKLCLLATLRSDGYPRISPIEPRIFEDQLVLVGMPGTTKFRDLGRDPRFNLHTATVDAYVGDGDAKLWGQVRHLPDPTLHERFADDLFTESGMDLRGQVFDPFFVADLTGGSSIEMDGSELVITIWQPGAGERIVRKI